MLRFHNVIVPQHPPRVPPRAGSSLLLTSEQPSRSASNEYGLVFALFFLIRVGQIWTDVLIPCYLDYMDIPFLTKLHLLHKRLLHHVLHDASGVTCGLIRSIDACIMCRYRHIGTARYNIKPATILSPYKDSTTNVHDTFVIDPPQAQDKNSSNRKKNSCFILTTVTAPFRPSS